MTQDIKYPEEVQTDAIDRALRLIDREPEEQEARRDKRKTRNTGW